MTISKQLKNTMTSLAGEHAVASQLCLKGYVASLTLKNFPGVDIFYHNPDTNKHGSLQVKTTLIGWVRIPKESDADQIYVLVNFQTTPTGFYIISYGKLLELANRERHLYVTEVKHRRPVTEEEQPLAITIGRNPGYSGFEEISNELEHYRDAWELLG